MFSPKNRQKIRQNPAKKITMTFVLAIVKSILATQRNDFGFNKCELKSLNNVGYCGKMIIFVLIPINVLEEEGKTYKPIMGWFFKTPFVVNFHSG